MSELTEARSRTAKPKERPYKLRDGRGLFCSSLQPAPASGVCDFGSQDEKA